MRESDHDIRGRHNEVVLWSEPLFHSHQEIEVHVSADPVDALVYYTLALNIFLSSTVSAKPTDTPVREIFGIPADTLSNLTLFSPLSILGQID